MSEIGHNSGFKNLKALRWAVWKSKEHTYVKILTLAILEFMEVNKLYSYPSRAYLAKMCGISENTLEKYWPRISPWIETTKRTGQSSIYRARIHTCIIEIGELLGKFEPPPSLDGGEQPEPPHPYGGGYELPPQPDMGSAVLSQPNHPHVIGAVADHPQINHPHVMGEAEPNHPHTDLPHIMGEVPNHPQIEPATTPTAWGTEYRPEYKTPSGYIRAQAHEAGARPSADSRKEGASGEKLITLPAQPLPPPLPDDEPRPEPQIENPPIWGMNAKLSVEEKRAQHDVAWLNDDTLRVMNGFRLELGEKYPLVPIDTVIDEIAAKMLPGKHSKTALMIKAEIRNKCSQQQRIEFSKAKARVHYAELRPAPVARTSQRNGESGQDAYAEKVKFAKSKDAEKDRAMNSMRKAFRGVAKQ